MVKRIDTDAISSRPEDRLRFLEGFLGFSDDDWLALRQSTEVIAPRLGELLDEVVEHLVAFDDTRRLFLKNGEVDPLAVAVRKQHLAAWIRMTVGASVEDREDFANYLNVVGRRQTGDASRVIAPRYLVGLAGFLQVALTRMIHAALPDEPERALRMSVAWNKMLVMQLEMFLKNVAPQWPHWDEPRICTGELAQLV